MAYIIIKINLLTLRKLGFSLNIRGFMNKRELEFKKLILANTRKYLSKGYSYLSEQETRLVKEISELSSKEIVKMKKTNKRKKK